MFESEGFELTTVNSRFEIEITDEHSSARLVAFLVEIALIFC